MRQKHCWNYFAFIQSYLAKGKIAPAVIWPHEAKEKWMILHWWIRTGSDWWFSKILQIRSGSDSSLSDQDWTQTEEIHSPLTSGTWHVFTFMKLGNFKNKGLKLTSMYISSISDVSVKKFSSFILVHNFELQLNTNPAQCCHSMLIRFPYNRNEKSLHFPTQAETKNAIIFSYNIWPWNTTYDIGLRCIIKSARSKLHV